MRPVGVRSLMKRQFSQLKSPERVTRPAMALRSLAAAAPLLSRGADGTGQRDDGQPAVGVPRVAAAIASRAL